MPLSPALHGYRAVLLDLDGCVWVGDSATPRAPEAVSALREAGLAVGFLTNDARHSVEAQVSRLWRLGFRASAQDLVTAGSAVQLMLAERGGGSAYVVGSQALVDHVAVAGLRIANGTDLASRADVVVVGHHDELHYRELRTAAQAVARGAELVATTREATFPMPDGAWPGTGAILAAIEAAAGRPADRVAGKPEPGIYAAALERLGVPAGSDVLAVGDRLDVDVAGAHAAGLHAALVLTGATDAADASAADPAPEHVAPTLGDLVLGAQ